MKRKNIFQKVYSHTKDLIKDDQTGMFRHLTFKKVLNYIKNMYSAISRKPYVNSYPIHITVDPANICQLKCPLCPTGQRLPSRQKGMMKFEDFKRIIDQLGDYIMSLSLFSWGEPLLDKDVFKMIEYAKSRKYNFVYLRDEDQRVANTYGAQCTPECFVFDEHRNLRYHGRVDDSPKDEAKATVTDLRNAVDALIHNRKVSIELAPAIGCSIKWR